MNYEDEILKLSNQICFPLYACGKEITRKYKPVLDKFGITYTQYLVLLVLWEKDGQSVKEIGNKIFLDSGTLTPLINKLCDKGIVSKKKNKDDERGLIISLTDNGKALKSKIVEVPEFIAGCVSLTRQEAETLYNLLYKVLGGLENE